MFVRNIYHTCLYNIFFFLNGERKATNSSITGPSNHSWIASSFLPPKKYCAKKRMFSLGPGMHGAQQNHLLPLFPSLPGIPLWEPFNRPSLLAQIWP